MKISAVVTSHNKGSTIARAVKAAAQNSQPPCEILVLEDCSTDGSQEILRDAERQFPALRVIHYHKKALDWMTAMLSFVDECQGDYIHFFGADDYPRATFYEACLPGEGHGVIFARVKLVDRQDRFLHYGDYSNLAPGSHRKDEELAKWLCSPVLPGGTATLLSKETARWLRDAGADKLGPWFDSIGYPAAMWAFGMWYLPVIHGVFTYEEDNYGGPKRSALQKAKERPGAEAFFAHRLVEEKLPEELRRALLDKVQP